MSLDGLRAWIGLLERKLTMRTRVFLVLVAIAIGGAGAGIYLGIEAQDDNGGGDVQAVQDELNGRIDTLESQIQALEAEGIESALPEAAPEPQPESTPRGNGGDGQGSDGGTEPELGGGVAPEPEIGTEPESRSK